ncbi:hypothetical protein A2U01_0021834 [Trifolium medium]|uniref:Uncharacterized protein n=1 Tax=Trifolium medium TaxID=97028 RepID=A0A392NN24_9FABA|nr:hypothetical protein [Trifolium medium]
MELRDLEWKIFRGSHVLQTARRAVVFGALRRSWSNSRIHLWQLRVVQPGLARRAVESSNGRRTTGSCASRRMGWRDAPVQNSS